MPVPVRELNLLEIIRPHDRQKAFLKAVDAHPYVLYGGAAGGGKSYILRWALIRYLMQCAAQGFRNVRVALFCENYPALQQRHMDRWPFEIPEYLGRMNKHERTFTLYPEYGSGVIYFLNLDDPAKYQSVEFAAGAIDELTKNQRNVFDFLKSRLRWVDKQLGPFNDTAGKNPKVKLFSGTNPGGPGHAWVRKWWIDRDFEDENGLNPDDFVYIPAKADDNPYLAPNYVEEQLGSLPEELRVAFRDGSWDLFSGQFFKEWRQSIHVCEPRYLDPSWERGLAVDYGYNDPFCGLWAARDPGTGRIYVYRELYERELTAQEQARRLIVEGALEQRRFAVADPAMWSRSAAGAPSPADIYAQHGLYLTPANNDRIGGWSLLRSGLRPMEDSRPGIVVFNTCENLVRTMPGLVYDAHRPEDCNTRGEDHAPDTLRYLYSAFQAFNATAEPVTSYRRKSSRRAFTGTVRW